MKTVLLALNASFSHTSLSGRYLRATCKQAGVEIDLLEMTINERAEQIAAAVFAKEPTVLACSVYIWNVRLMQDVCTRIKLMNPGIVIVWGGPEVSFDAGRILGENSFIDHICTGEGEVAFAALLQGLAIRESYLAPIFTEERLPLDQLPDPYAGEKEFQPNKLYYFESSRGGPYACAYCLSSTAPGVRFLSLDVTKKRLSLLSEKVSIVKFVDRTFNANPARARELWSYLLDLPGECRFHFEICAHLLDEEDFILLSRSESRRFQFEVGLQTTAAESLQAINRAMDTEKLLRNVARLRQLGTVEIHLDLIAGLPGETYNRFLETVDQALSVRPHRLHLGFLKLLPGTPLRQQQEQETYFLPFAPYEVMSTPCISAQELLRLKALEHSIDKFYNSRKLENSLTYVLETITLSPSAFFSGLIETSADSLHSSLFNVAQSQVNKELLFDLLRMDYLLHEPHRKIPDWMSQEFDEGKALRKIVYESEEKLYEVLPHRVGERPGLVLRDLRLGSFGDQYLIFDHSQPVSNRVFPIITGE